MPVAGVVLVAVPEQQAVVDAVAERVPVAGTLMPGRGTLRAAPAPRLPDAGHLLRAADACCFLAPYPGLAAEVLRLVQHRIPVLCAGPPALTRRGCLQLVEEAAARGVLLTWGGVPRYSRLHQALVLQTQKPAFGQAVHWRWLGGGGPGLVGAWWTLCQALDQVVELLGSEVRAAHVTSTRRGRRYQVTLTLSTAQQATAQLVVVPEAPSPAADTYLLGTGGLLCAAAVGNTPVLIRAGRVDLAPHPAHRAEPEWVAAFLEAAGRTPALRQPAGFLLNLQQAVLTGLRTALRQRLPVPVSVPPSAAPMGPTV